MPTGLGDEKLWISATNDNTGTSTAFDDQSGNGNNGTASGTLVVADTSEGGSYAFDFDGVDDYIDTGSTTVHQNTVFSYAFWLNASASNSGTEGTAGSYETSGGKRGPLAASLLGDNKLTWLYMSLGTVYNSAQSLKSSGDVYDSTWRHVICEFDGDNNEVKIYIDGSLDSSKTASVPDIVNISTALKFGAGSGGFTDGKMDDIRVYNRVLTQSEITHLASSRGVEGPPPVGLGDEQLWLCPSLNDSADDISGNGNDGTLAGGTAIVSDTGSGGTKSFESYTTATDRVDIPAGVFTDGNDVSFSLWVKNKQTTAGSKVRNIFRSTNSDIQLYANQTRYRGVAGGVTAEDTLVNLNTTEYYHYALNYDNASSSIELFRNGVSVATASGAAATTLSGTLDLLQNSIAFVDDVRAYNRVLTQSDISWLATERGVLGTPPEGLGDEQLWLCPSIQDSANDLSGNNNNGTYQNGMGTVTDTAEGGTRAYDGTTGTSDYVSVTWPNSNLTTRSMSVWMQPVGFGQFSNHIPIAGPIELGSPGNQIAFRNYLSSWPWNSTYSASSSAAQYNSSWHCFTFVQDPSNTDVYVDGVLFNSYSTHASTNYGSGNGVFNIAREASYIDDFRVFDRALTTTEITHLASQRGVLGAPALPEGLGDEQLWLCPSIDDGPNDISGNGNNGTYVGGMGTVTSDGKLCYDFDGSNDYIDLNDQWNFTGNYSYSLWINKDSGSSVQVIGNRDTNADGWLTYINGSNVLRSYNDTTATSSSTPVISNSTWYCITVTYDGTNLSVYKNGVLDSSVAASQQTASTRNAEIGRYTNNAAYNGQIDDVRFYDRVLTQAEITHLASSRGVEGPPPVGLGDEQLWLCPSINDSANDISGSGNDGTYQGGMGTVLSDGKLAYDFDGVDDYIDGSLSTALGSSVSSSCWIKFDAAPAATETFISNDGFTTDGWLVQRLATSPAKLRYAEDASVSSFCDNSYLNSTGWRHIVSVRDGSTVSLYIDGVQLAVTNSSITGAIAKTAFNIGRRLDSASQYSACVMDDIRLYDRTLTQAEITHLASSRGIEGPPPVGLGDEQLWLCPSLNDSPNDISGSGNDGTYNGGMGTVADVSNGGSRCYSFDGTNDYISNSSLDLRNLPAMSWSAWVLDYKTSGVSSFFSHGISGVFTNDTIFYQSSGNNSFQINQSADGGGYTSKPTAGTWHHLVCVFDGSGATDSDRLRYFLDGVEVGLVYNYTVPALTGNPSSSSTMIGNYVCAPTNFFPGKQDDIRVYTRVLTQAEITHLATSRGIEGSPSTPTAQYNAFATHAFKQLFQTRLR
jgi:hypothetical protein